MNDDQAVEAFLAWMRDKRAAQPATLDKYRLVLHAYVDHLQIVGQNARRADPAVVEAFTGRSRRGGAPAANATVAVEVAVLASFYRWAQARLRWLDNPALLAGRPKVHNRQPRPLSDERWLAVWRSPLSTDAKVALGLGFFCGLRRSEVVELHGGQIWNGRIVSFTRKGGGEDHFDYDDVLDHFAWTLPHLGATELREPLVQLARSRGDRRLMPWTNPRPVAFNRQLDNWLAELGLPSFTPHQLRHSFATNLVRSGVPLDVACDLCNHSSPKITMRYIKTSGGRLAALRQPAALNESGRL